MSLALPTDLNIVGVGGCGKGLVTEVLKHDWFIEEYLSRTNFTLNVMTIDTDTGQLEDDLKFCKQITNHISDLQTERHYHGSVLCRHYHLPDYANVNTIQDLSDIGVCEKMKRSSSGIHVWWMNDPENGVPYKDMIALDPKLTQNFSGGVQRRRAISKAVFQKALHEGAGKGFPTFHQPGTYAIFVGLGGGSGSGMFLDVARQIRKEAENKTIWLFAILPSTKEDEKEKLNAAIALSELEYLNLTNENLFDHLVLASLGPTGYGGRGSSGQEVDDFDLAFPYIFVNALNFSTADRAALTASCSEYSGFIVADAHVIEYPVENLQRLRRTFLESVEIYSDMVEKRTEIITALDQFITTSSSLYPDVISEESASLPLQEVEIYKNELLNLQRFWNSYVAKLLTFKTPEWIHTAVKHSLTGDMQDISSIETFTDLCDFVETLRNELENNPLNSIDEHDLRFYSVIKESFVLLEKIGVLYQSILTIRDENIRLLLIKLIHGETEIGTAQGTLVRLGRNLEKEETTLKKSVESLETDMKKLTGEWNKICADVGTKMAAVSSGINAALESGTILPKVTEMETTLSNEFTQYIYCLQQATDEAKHDQHPKKKSSPEWKAAIPMTNLNNVVADSQQDLGYDVSYISDIAKEASAYYHNLYMEQAALKQKFLDRPKLDPSIFKTQSMTKAAALEALCNQHPDFVTLDKQSMTLTVRSGFLIDEFERNANESVDTILLPLTAEFKLNDFERDSLKTLLGTRISAGSTAQDIYSSLESAIVELLNQRGGYSGKISALQSQIEEKTESFPVLQSQIAFCTKVLELPQITTKSRNDYETSSKRYVETISSLPTQNEDEAVQGRETANKYRTRLGRINPGLLPRITDEPSLSLASVLDGAGTNDQIKKAIDEEIESLITNVTTKSRSLIDPELLGVKQFGWTYDGAGGSNVNQWRLNTSFLGVAAASVNLTTSLTATEEILKKTLQKSFSHKSVDGAHVICHNNTKPWEIVLTLFASGNFLENTLPFNASGGYLDSYSTGKNKDNILHHALLLQEGKYITREMLEEKRFAEIAATEARSMEIDGKSPKGVVLEQYTVKEIREAFGHDSQQ